MTVFKTKLIPHTLVSSMLASILIVLLTFSGLMPVHAATYDCSAQTDIPQAECEALLAVYNSTDGANWSANTNWLDANPCTWYGVTCVANHVTVLDLHHDSLAGTIPSEIGNLTSLVDLELRQNHLSGTIPPEIGNLLSLQTLSLSYNRLTGSIPSQIGSLTGVTSLNMFDNQLTGPIPSQIGSLTGLTYLNLSRNQLDGDFPAAIGALTSLDSLNLGENQLTGTIPASIASLTSLQTLSLSYNRLGGSIPPEIGSLSKLSGLALSSNNLTGGIPAEIGNLNKLALLFIDDNLLSGDIPSTIVNLIHLNYLKIYENSLTASDPAVIAFLAPFGDWQSTQTVTPTDVAVVPDPSSPAVTVSWSYASSLSYFEVGYSLTPGGPYTSSTTTNHSLQLNGLTANTPYYFVVRTITERENYPSRISPWSAEISATTNEQLPTATPTEIPSLELLQPASGAVIADPVPQFQWTTYPGANTFRFRLRDSFDATILNVSLSPNDVCDETTCQIELEAFDTVLEDSELYFWQINVNNGQYISAEFSFSTKFATPGAFNLLEPADGGTVSSSAPIFRWTVSENAAQYRVRVLDSFDMRVINTTISATTSPSVGDICQEGICVFDSSVLGVELDHNEDYEWNVRAKNSFGKKKAIPAEFTVLLPVPGKFNLLTPTDASSVNTLQPVLTWEESANATEYRIRMRNDTDDTLVLKINDVSPAACIEGVCTVDTASFTYLNMLENGESYVWKVQARNQYGKQKSNHKLTFTVELPGRLASRPDQVPLP